MIHIQIKFWRDKVHQCCGCSCHVCKHTHSRGTHTEKCKDRFWDEVDKDNPHRRKGLNR